MKYKTSKNKQHKTSKFLESLGNSVKGLKIVLSLSAARLFFLLLWVLDSWSSLGSCPTCPLPKGIYPQFFFFSPCWMKSNQQALLRRKVQKKSVLGCGEELQV